MIYGIDIDCYLLHQLYIRIYDFPNLIPKDFSVEPPALRPSNRPNLETLPLRQHHQPASQRRAQRTDQPTKQPAQAQLRHRTQNTGD